MCYRRIICAQDSCCREWQVVALQQQVVCEHRRAAEMFLERQGPELMLQDLWPVDRRSAEAQEPFVVEFLENLVELLDHEASHCGGGNVVFSGAVRKAVFSVRSGIMGLVIDDVLDHFPDINVRLVHAQLMEKLVAPDDGCVN
eukprot:TRINITY_DN23725_c0_g1_i1.p2 TRINITY_DN23725_c0_g1~~TRINITY_DN23725_c0_g1_i1.p2  ORF type:complete len:143 (+),score=39.28 TRINITY_DN23725_c0_g1_i1:156-584(+)